MIRHLTLRQLQVFAEAARQLSFSRTAETLHLTQPAVSMQIRQLEEAVGLALFERVGRRLALTEAGQILRLHAARVMGELQDAEQAISALQGLRGGRVAVGLVSTAKYFTPRLLSMFSASYPDIEVRLLVGNREELIRMLENNEIDLAVMGRPPEKLDVISEACAANPHVLAAARGHRLEGRRGLDLHELRTETFLLREPGSGTRNVMEALFKQHLFKPARAIIMGSNETVKQAVMAGIGISLLSLHTLSLELRAGEVCILDISSTPVRRNWHIVHMRSKQLSPAAARFRLFLLEEMARFLADYVPAIGKTRAAAARKCRPGKGLAET